MWGGAQHQQLPEVTTGPETTHWPYKAQKQGYWNFSHNSDTGEPLEVSGTGVPYSQTHNRKQADRGFTVLETLWGFIALPLCWSEVHLPRAMGLSLVWGRWQTGIRHHMV
jgi:hypothetical protein